MEAAPAAQGLARGRSRGAMPGGRRRWARGRVRQPSRLSGKVLKDEERGEHVHGGDATAPTRRRLRTVTVLALATLAGAPQSLAGGHMTSYHSAPEHDDLGRSDEPDVASTRVLGPLLTGCNVDDNLDGVCEPYPTVPANPRTGSEVLAPGCSDDSGRRASGLCWLHLRTGVGVGGMTGSAAPGAFTHTKADPVRFLDAQVVLQPVRTYVEAHHKLEDSGLTPLLGGLQPGLGGPFAAGPAGLTAWYGTWTDRNGNGVIDHGDDAARNEFRWLGHCGGSPPTPAHACQVQPTTMPAWLFPGNHHTFLVPDLPGTQALCFLTIVAQVPLCTASIAELDDYDEAFQGDPLLGPQGSRKPDVQMADRTDFAPTARHYVAGNGFPLYHYDQSLVTREVLVVAADPAPGLVGGFDPGEARFRDVDVLASWTPGLEALLGGLRPGLRGQWVVVRDGYAPVNTWLDGRLNSRNTGAGRLNPLLGPLDDRLLEPGRSHEPNDGFDAYPGATFGRCFKPENTHRGVCNRYTGYRLAPHAWADVNLFRTGHFMKPTVMGQQPLPLFWGPFVIDSGFPGNAPRGPGDHSRGLAPGIYDVLGNVGVWQDRTQVVEERVWNPADPTRLDPPPRRYAVSPDGWVGDIVNSTGQWRYRDYPRVRCSLYGVVALYEWAQCDPYASGAVGDPQDYGTPDGEFKGACTSPPSFFVRPAGSTWNFPVFVWRDLETFEATQPRLEDWTGKTGPIALRVECIAGTSLTTGTLVGRDMLVLPLGSQLGITAVLTAKGIVPAPGLPPETVKDVDRYRAYLT